MVRARRTNTDDARRRTGLKAMLPALRDAPRALLAGVLSVTTAGLLVPVAPALALHDGDAGLLAGGATQEGGAAAGGEASALGVASGDGAWTSAAPEAGLSQADVAQGSGSQQGGTSADAAQGGFADEGGEGLSSVDATQGDASTSAVTADGGAQSEAASGGYSDGQGASDGSGSDGQDGVAQGESAVDGQSQGDSGEAGQSEDVQDAGGQPSTADDEPTGESGNGGNGSDGTDDAEAEDTACELVGSALLGDDELVSGTAEVPAAYGSGSVRFAFWARSDDVRVTLEANNQLVQASVAPLEGAQDTYEALATLADATYSSIRLRVEDAQGHSCEATFEHVLVDTEAPTYELLWDQTSPVRLVNGVRHVAGPCSLRVLVHEANPADELAVLVNGREVQPTAAAGTLTYELSLEQDGAYELGIRGSDVLGREPQVADGAQTLPASVVVDTQAPAIEVEPLAPDVVAQGEDGASLFFAHETAIRIAVRDELGLESVHVEPADVCEVDDGGLKAGDAEATITLSLAEGSELTRDVVLTAWDLAGNWRTWSIGPEGTTFEAGAEGAAQNAAPWVAADGEPVFPLMLLLDTTAPVVEIRGVEDAQAYGQAPEVTVSVEEASFAYLASFAGQAFGDQPVLFATTAQADAQTEERGQEAGESGPGAGDSEPETVDSEAGDEAWEGTPLLYVRDFSYNDLTCRWEASVRLDQDASYVLEAQLTDVAGNVSARAQRRLVVDTFAPECEVEFVRDEVHVEEHEGAYYRSPRRARVRVREHNWDALRDLNLRYVAEDGTEHAVDASAFEDAGDDWHECLVDFEEDGRYQLLLDAVDVAGNRMSPWASQEFWVDTTAPQISVSYEGPAAKAGGYYGAAHVATVTVVEHNWGDGSGFEVGVRKGDAPAGLAPKPTAWRVPDKARPDVHTCTVAFDVDGRFELRVSGRDLAGHVALCEGREGFLDEFVVDLEAPLVEVGFLPVSYAELDGVKYLRHAIEVPVSVADRNLNAAATSVSWDANKLVGDARLGWDVSAPDAQGMVRRSRSVSFGQGRHVSPCVVATDLAGHVTRVEGEAFVVDLGAPRITTVSTTSEPTATYQTSEAGEPGQTQFFGQSTQLVFEASDEFALEGATLYDPDGQYVIESCFQRGSTAGRVVVSLQEGTASHATDAYERNIVLTVADVAGNLHAWTLDRQGEVVADEVWEGAEPTLNDSWIEPLALVQDSVAPQLSVTGVDAGLVTNQTQVAHISVSERNFSYLKAFRPSDVVVRITERDATPQRNEHVEEVRVASFEGDDPVWSYAKEFAHDGHYAIAAQVTDVAGHVSNRVEVAEFTVDKTPPTIEVLWDHDLSQARLHAGTHYFNTTRHATVIVREHNFRAEDVQVDAGSAGVVGPWTEAEGDAHVCVVDYDTEAKGCYLTVRAADEAGNEARAYEQRDFAIDLTPPAVHVYNVPGPSGELAFAQGVTPVLAFDDGQDGSFDAGPDGWSYELRGKREQNGASRADLRRFGQTETYSDAGAVVTFADFGAQEGQDGSYDVSFDDVYTLTVRVRDLAGNEGEPLSVTFSVNRFGSNFFVEDLEGLSTEEGAQGEDVSVVRPLSQAPCIVVHEVNVSGAASELDHSVLRDYANVPEELVRDAQGESHAEDDAGYSLQASSEASGYNEFEGWSEYVYTIRSGNFGEGAFEESDGQGIYRVNVVSVDAASNQNSTSRYWSSDPERSDAADKSATVTFTLDELPPAIDYLDLGKGLSVGDSYEATFHVTDDISCGDEVEVLVDGVPAEVYVAATGQPAEAGIATGTYAFRVPARPFAAQSVSVRITDYDGRVATVSGSLSVTTLVAETSVALLLVALGAAVGIAWLRRRQAAEPELPHAV